MDVVSGLLSHDVKVDVGVKVGHEDKVEVDQEDAFGAGLRRLSPPG